MIIRGSSILEMQLYTKKLAKHQHGRGRQYAIISRGKRDALRVKRHALSLKSSLLMAYAERW